MKLLSPCCENPQLSYLKIAKAYLWSLLILAFLLAGCGGPQLVKVTGKVMINGKAAEGAVLLFHPNDANNLFVSTATTNSDGTYTVVTDMQDGIPPGTYKVTLTWPEPSTKPVQDVPFAFGTAADRPDLLKGKFVSKDSSGLTAVIGSSTTEIPAFELSMR